MWYRSRCGTWTNPHKAITHNHAVIERFRPKAGNDESREVSVQVHVLEVEVDAVPSSV